MVARRDECKGWWKTGMGARGGGKVMGDGVRSDSKKGWCKGH